jgi:crotonobetainyl-CoA:carnitine CoA-transferase CaiB-like acyl-CoA transferase
VSHEYPLEGIKVVDTSQGIAGPSAGMMLALYGADVVKVEPREGDWARSITSGAAGVTSMVVATNLGKRSIALDLKHPQGAGILKALAERADVFIENFRTGVMDRLGFGYAGVSAYNPSVVYLSVTGFGQQGPMRDQPATDTVLQAFSGFMTSNRGREDGLPHRLECWPIDVATGQYAFQAVAMALYARRDCKRGRYIDASLLQGAAALQTVRIIEHVVSGGASTVSSAFPVGTFQTADGWINVTVLKDSLWPPFCRVLGRDDLAADPALATGAGRRARAAEILGIAADVLRSQRAEHWSKQFREAGILHERVNSYDEMLAHPQIEAVRLYTWQDQPGTGRVPLVNMPGWQPLEPGSERARVPRVGEHTRDILAELGVDAAGAARLIADRAVFTT